MKKTAKTLGYALISATLYFSSGLLAGSEIRAVVMATITVVLLKTPVYWTWEHAFEFLWSRKGRQPEKLSPIPTHVPFPWRE